MRQQKREAREKIEQESAKDVQLKAASRGKDKKSKKLTVVAHDE